MSLEFISFLPDIKINHSVILLMNNNVLQFITFHRIQNAKFQNTSSRKRLPEFGITQIGSNIGLSIPNGVKFQNYF